MPAGRYTVLDGPDRAVGIESFRCAPGPAGWRYVSQIETSDPTSHHEVVDLAVNREWRPVRLRIETGSHSLLLAAQEDRLVGERDGEPVDFVFGPDVEIDYLSPCFNAVTATRLGLTAEFPVVYLEPVTCLPHLERQRYELEGPDVVTTPVGRFEATRWRYTSLPGGWSGRLWLAADVVVRFEGLFELAEYEPGPRGPFPQP